MIPEDERLWDEWGWEDEFPDWPDHGYGCPCSRCARTHAPVREPAPPAAGELSFQEILALRGPQLREIRALPETHNCPPEELL